MNPELPHPPASEADIARRARSIWASRGCPDGCDVEIWLEAERELSTASPSDPNKTVPVARTSTTISAKGVRPTETDPIDDRALATRLNEFGESPRRSPTSVNLN
jgi:hypothetical protein